MENHTFDDSNSSISVKDISSGIKELQPQYEVPRQQPIQNNRFPHANDKKQVHQHDYQNQYHSGPQQQLVNHSKQKFHIPVKSFYENYQVISNLGKGSFGSVTLARYRKDKYDLLRKSTTNRGTMLEPLSESYGHLDSLVAIKTMNKRLPTLSDYHRVKEIKFIHTIPSHPALVQIYELFVDNTHYQLHIVMESMNSNLYQLVKHRKDQLFSAPTLKSILTQLLSAIRHIHRCDYFHRDIKPENILVVPTSLYYGSVEAIPPHRKGDNYIVKLADYGLARSIYNNRPYTAYVSTRWYRSPELLLRRKWYGKPFDIWAFGTVAVELANFCPLFPGENEIEQIWKILTVLGHPSLPNRMEESPMNYKIPLGGYWEEARVLAARLGIILPYHVGESIGDILPNPKYVGLQNVVKACLTWDPDARADIDTVCSLPYFDNSEVSRPYCLDHMPMEVKLKPTHKGGAKPTMKDAQTTFQVLTGIKLSSSNKLQSSQNKIVKLASRVIRSTLKEMNVGQENSNTQNPSDDISKEYMYDDFDDGYENDFMGSYLVRSNNDHNVDSTNIEKFTPESNEELPGVFEEEFQQNTSAAFNEIAQIDLESYNAAQTDVVADEGSLGPIQRTFNSYYGHREEELFSTDLNRVPGELEEETLPGDSSNLKPGPGLFKVIDYDSDEQNSGDSKLDTNYVWNELNHQCHNMRSQDLSLVQSEVSI